MAIFNATLKSGAGPSGVYSAFCETEADFKAPATEPWGEGSTVVCLNVGSDKGPSVHVKLPDGRWTEVSGKGSYVEVAVNG